MRAAQQTTENWSADPSQLATIARIQQNPRLWRDRLVRLASLLPPNGMITAIVVNPNNLTDPSSQGRSCSLPAPRARQPTATAA